MDIAEARVVAFEAAKSEKFLGVKLVEEYHPTPGDCYVILTRPYGEPTPPPAVFIINTFQRWLEVRETMGVP